MRRLALVISAAFVLLPAEPGRPQIVRAATPRVQHGLASFYGRGFDGHLSASGVRFDKDRLVAAHPSLPFGTVVRVTNIENQEFVHVTIIDRGPAPRLRKKGVIIDVSYAAAKSLGFVRKGRARVRVDVVRRPIAADASPSGQPALEPRHD